MVSSLCGSAKLPRAKDVVLFLEQGELSPQAVDFGGELHAVQRAVGAPTADGGDGGVSERHGADEAVGDVLRPMLRQRDGGELREHDGEGDSRSSRPATTPGISEVDDAVLCEGTIAGRQMAPGVVCLACGGVRSEATRTQPTLRRSPHRQERVLVQRSRKPNTRRKSPRKINPSN